jgi:alkylhydroperoxidase family enzyme
MGQLRYRKAGVLLETLRAPRDVEIGCDDCLIQVASYCETELAGKELPEALRLVVRWAHTLLQPEHLKKFSSGVLNQTDDRFSDLDRTFPMREVTDTFEHKPLISPGKKPLKALRLFWVVTIVESALNHESESRQALHFTEPPLQ